MRRLDEIGLFAGQEVVLLELAAHDELNQTELAAALDVEPPSVTSIVGKLEAAGLVTRVARGREKRITLTPPVARARRKPARCMPPWNATWARTSRPPRSRPSSPRC